MNIVREAFVGSETCTFATFPPFKQYTSQLSTVPKARVPFSYASLTLGTLFTIHKSLVDEGYVERGRPQILIRSSKPFFLFNSRTISADRVSVQTMALYSGSPVSASQTTVVSRWLVIPTLLIDLRGWPAASNSLIASLMQVLTEETISRGSCSCQLLAVSQKTPRPWNGIQKTEGWCERGRW